MNRVIGEKVSDVLVPDTEATENPQPDNFDVFLPWACRQLGVDVDFVIICVQVHSTYAGPRAQTSKEKNKSKPHASKHDTSSDQDERSGLVKSISFDPNDIKIYTIYDISGNLLQLKFDKNKRIPRVVLKVIGLILQYHIHLTTITINRGLDNGTVYELNKLLPLCNITDICLDNTDLPDANYDILLEDENNLKHLSLSRCKIDDDVLKRIASKLSFPLPASKTLSILNLATNRITDTGAKYLAEVLKMNRQLAYLNIADNSITDEGSIAILNVLGEFLLSTEEVRSYRSRHFVYCREKNEAQIAAEQPAEDKKAKRKSVKPNSTNTVPAKRNKLTNENEEDDFKDPFSQKNVNNRDDMLYCTGNNYLAYLNISYNDISYFTVKKLLDVLSYQKMLDRKPKGLVNVSIEGNCIPVTCRELTQINEILGAVNGNTKGLSTVKKKLQSKDMTK